MVDVGEPVYVVEKFKLVRRWQFIGAFLNKHRVCERFLIAI